MILSMGQEKAEYSLKNGFVLHYDPQQCLPPDIVSEAIGYEAAQAVNAINFLGEQPARPVRLIELGVGTGIG